MKYVIRDKEYSFATAFDTQTGTYIRSGILDKRGRDTGVDPFMASFPHLVDVGVMGHCLHGISGLCVQAGIDCYQSGMKVQKANMSLEQFAWIAAQCEGRCNQFALGGRGDPDQHEHFEDLLKTARKHKIVPNFTTSGYKMTPSLAALCKTYCGAVAVSWYRSDYSLRAINLLLKAGVRTNIHYVLDRHSIDEALDRLAHNSFPAGINAVIFLLYKPAGQGTKDKVLKPSDPRVGAFFRLLEQRHPFKTGLDSCSVPGTIHHCSKIAPESLDTCEGGRFSCYIGADMQMLPCSFDQSQQYAVDLNQASMAAAWNGPQFEAFRQKLRLACPDCSQREACMGGCPLFPDIVLCQEEERTQQEEREQAYENQD